MLASTSVCFDPSVFELFVPLTMGGTVTLTEHTALDLIDSGSRLSGVSLVNTVPSIGRELLDHDALPRTATTINLAGEALAPDLVQRLYQQPHVRAVNNLYGPSTKPGHRFFCTGNLARWCPDGQLDYHGRTDHQIKLHGH